MGFGRRNRVQVADNAAQDAEAADPAIDAAARDRLQALKRRAAQVEQLVSEHTKPASSVSAIELAQNPFAVLELDLAVDASAIDEAYDRLSFEPGRDEAALTAARAALMSPRERLAAEIRWLPATPKPTMLAICAALRAGERATLATVHGKLNGAGRFNIASALFESNPSDGQAALALFMDAGGVDPEALLEILDEARFSAREREIDRALFEECLADRAREAGARAAPAFADTAAGRLSLTRALQNAPQPRTRFDTAFREALLVGYGADIAQGLDRTRASIDEAIRDLREDPGKGFAATTLLTSLDLWSGLRRPMQVHEAARGLDDPASGELFAAVRSLSIDLSNQHDQFELSLRLARALLACFAAVPIHRSALERELPTLIGNAAVKCAKELHERALAQPRTIARQIENGGLEGVGGLAGSIRILFEDVAGLYDGNALEAIFSIIRDIAIRLHNEARERAAAYALLAWLSNQGPPLSLAAKLEDDLRHFGVQANIAVRADAPSQSVEPGETDVPARAPTAFGRARTGGIVPPGGPPPSSPDGTTPNDESRLPSRPPRPPRARSYDDTPAGRKDRQKGARGTGRFCVALVVLFTVMCNRPHSKADKAEAGNSVAEHKAASQPVPGGTFRAVSSPSSPRPVASQRRFSDEDINAIVERLRRERSAPGVQGGPDRSGAAPYAVDVQSVAGAQP